jgi:hypothetical protein
LLCDGCVKHSLINDYNVICGINHLYSTDNVSDFVIACKNFPVDDNSISYFSTTSCCKH